MRLLVLSDLHLEVAPFDVASTLDFDVAILAGDIGAPGVEAMRWMLSSPALQGRAVVFVPGNHEYYGSHMETTRARMRALARSTQVHVLDADAVCVGGVRFLGATLWTDFALARQTPDGLVSDPAQSMRDAALCMGDYQWIRTTSPEGEGGFAAHERALRPQDTARLHAQQRAWLSARLSEPFAGPTVVVTHHAPHRGSLSPAFASHDLSAAFVSELPAAFFAVPVLWVHGHTHARFDYVEGHTRVICNPRGSGRACHGFDPHCVIEV